MNAYARRIRTAFPFLPGFWARAVTLTLLVAVGSWSLPAQFEGATGINRILGWNDARLRPQVRELMLWTGLFQIWNMFVHKPGQANLWYDAWLEVRVERADGSRASYVFPRMRDAKAGANLTQFRYRKFLDSANPTVAPQELPFIARYYARQDQQAYPASTPRLVKLVLQSRRIMPPGEPAETTFREYPYLDYAVKPEDLKP